MTVRELKERLEDYSEDAEIRIAHQPNYPLQSHVRGICSDGEARDLDIDEAPGDQEVVYVVESCQVRDTPYAPRGAFDAAWA